MPRWTRATLDETATVGAGTGHHTKAELSVTTQMGQERLKRLQAQNELLHHELKKLRGISVPLEDIKKKVVNANVIVRNQLLMIPRQVAPDLAALTDARAIERRLHKELVAALNGLAYGPHDPPAD